MNILHVLAEIFDRAADLLTPGTRRHALMDLHMAEQGDPMLVLAEADVAFVSVSV